MGSSRMTPKTERRLLQAAVLVAGIVPVSAGAAGVILGARMAGGGSIDLDSHVRYLSGLLLGIGLVFWGMVPGIERHKLIVRVLTVLVVIGGLGRMLGVFVAGTPSAPMAAALGMELVVTPLLCLWQSRIARLAV